jgi:putative tricarboxylic transport membrane protein
MGALIMYNVQPGPLLFEQHPNVAWGLIASMFIGNIMLLILNMPLIKVFAKVIETPPKFLLPMIIAISVFGVYAVRLTIFDLILLVICGLAGYFFTRHDFPVAPLVLGLVLGSMIEYNMRRALTISNGDMMIFLQKPISALLLAIAAAWVLVPVVMKMRGRKVLVNEEA